MAFRDTNAFFLGGRLVRDAETKKTSNGLFIANFSIATNYNKKGADGNYVNAASFFNFSIYGNMAEALAPSLIQGTKVLVEGHHVQRRWEKDGKKESRVEFVVERLELNGRSEKKDVQPDSQPSNDSGKDEMTNEIPLGLEDTAPEYPKEFF